MKSSSFCRIVSLALLAGAGFATTAAQALELRGFRGVPWGAGVDSLGVAQLAERSGDVSCYRRENENMLFGDSQLKDVRYCFHRDHLFMVTLDAQVSLDTLVQEFQSTYGPPDRRAAATTGWGDRSTSARVEMQVPPQGGTSMLVYSNEYEPPAK
jgi:hypothetical protein